MLSRVVYLNSIRERHKLTRSAVLRPKFAPWMQLLNFEDETSFLDLTGFSRAAFMQLETACFTEQDGIRTGRPPCLAIFVLCRLSNEYKTFMFNFWYCTQCCL